MIDKNGSENILDESFKFKFKLFGGGFDDVYYNWDINPNKKLAYFFTIQLFLGKPSKHIIVDRMDENQRKKAKNEISNIIKKRFKEMENNIEKELLKLSYIKDII